MIDTVVEKLEGEVRGELVVGPGAATTGVVVLGGSSGRVDVGRAQLFAEAGTRALALQWFGGTGQAPGICEIPLETFVSATDHMMAIGCRRIVFVGTSKGAEAALLTAIRDPRVNAVVAINPSSVVWGNIGPGIDGIAWPERSSWSFGGVPLDFVPFIPGYAPAYRQDLVSFRGLFEHCLRHSRDDRSEIPIEAAAADILLIAGGDDAVWPSAHFAQALSRRRTDHGRPVALIADTEAGHRVLFPGEKTPRSIAHAHGGSDAADARLGQAAWPQVLALL
ncbi:MAG: acyl-CoA thioester hydrolase/BAAT C-terminal domain-containing protein [Pantoea sp.]|uniref:acyl-CoA thioester hydrolase/BAAT C-terminal domain-containing protein n=1 Tax=Pantoea sp. TaxID=69393 RepID=UPI0023A02C70|nr:acyl-CoA thioester hydrolase/BAAT C-terminal domain-containing protein [Pantoea sp.]MDE1186283.1 acyl-CoA thioester hydrolase/BAAT C-terminal domain-containing protein [Pantoea sp.]